MRYIIALILLALEFGLGAWVFGKGEPPIPCTKNTLTCCEDLYFCGIQEDALKAGIENYRDTVWRMSSGIFELGERGA